jgi:hypothetical protein
MRLEKMETLNKDELFLIAKLLDLQTFLNFKKTNKRMDELCKKDDIWYYILERDYDKPEVRFTDEILLKYPKIRALNASNNPKITDKSVKELKSLHTLNACCNRK